jgi:hypothetical protein
MVKKVARTPLALSVSRSWGVCGPGPSSKVSATQDAFEQSTPEPLGLAWTEGLGVGRGLGAVPAMIVERSLRARSVRKPSSFFPLTR